MNIFSKIACRTYQIVFRIAIPFLPYREPKLIEGIDKVPETLKNNKISRVMLVTDKGVRGLGLTKHLEDLLYQNGILCTVFDDTVANPTFENVYSARDLYLKNNCEAIIAFGGGSSMDCAKAVGAVLARPKKPLIKMKGVLKILKKIPLLIAVPTTAGTGSEVTLAAVITDERTHRKYPINDFCLIPRFAVMEPEVTIGLPKNLTATTGMDALTHAVEAYIGRSTTKDTRTASVAAIALIFANLEKAYNNPSDTDARRYMLHAAYLAGLAFTKSYVGYVHAVAHSLGGKYKVAHGYANAVLLPHVLRAYGDKVYKKLAKLALLTELVDNKVDEKTAALTFIEKIEKMNKDMNIPTFIEELKKEDIPSLAKYASAEGNPLYPVPVLMNAKELEKLYETVLKK